MFVLGLPEANRTVPMGNYQGMACSLWIQSVAWGVGGPSQELQRAGHEGMAVAAGVFPPYRAESEAGGHPASGRKVFVGASQAVCDGHSLRVLAAILLLL